MCMILCPAGTFYFLEGRKTLEKKHFYSSPKRKMKTASNCEKDMT